MTYLAFIFFGLKSHVFGKFAMSHFHLMDSIEVVFHASGIFILAIVARVYDACMPFQCPI